MHPDETGHGSLIPPWPEDRWDEIAENFDHLSETRGIGRLFRYRQTFSVACAEQRRRLFAYVLGIRPSVIVFGVGNGSRMSKSEKRALYLGQAAIGILIGLGFLWLEVQMLSGSWVDANGALAVPPRHHMPLPPGVHWQETPLSAANYYELAITIISLCTVAAVARIAWARNEFPPIAALWGGGIAALLGFFAGAAVEVTLDLQINLHISRTLFLLIPLCPSLIGAILTLHAKYGTNMRACLFYAKVRILAEGVAGGASASYFVSSIILILSYGFFLRDALPDYPEDMPASFFYILIGCVVAGATLGLRWSLREFRHLMSEDIFNSG